MSDIRIFPAQAERVETGPVQFGDDWPGVFIRGDNAGYYLHCLSFVVDDLKKKFETTGDLSLYAAMNSLMHDLSGCVVGPAVKRDPDWITHPWNAEDPRCVLCGHPMMLNDGCEWPESDALKLCESCVYIVLENILQKLQKSVDSELDL